MVRFDAVLDRLHALPDDRKEAVAAQIDLMLDQDDDDPLTPEQWAEIEARLDTQGAPRRKGHGNPAIIDVRRRRR